MVRKHFQIIVLIALAVSTAAAQTKPEQSVVSARDQFFGIKNRSIEMERVKRDAGKKSVGADYTRQFPLIKEDFEEIQKLNARILQIIAVKTPPEYAAVAKFVSEINKRAARLNANLFSDDLKEKKKTKRNESRNIEEREITVLFKALDESIANFVHNSIFQNINLVSSEDSLKARNDLKAIIDISHAIKSKKLN